MKDPASRLRGPRNGGDFPPAGDPCRRASIADIRITTSRGRIGIDFEGPRKIRHRRHRARFMTPARLRDRASMLERAAKRMRIRARKLQRKAAAKARKKP